MREELPAMAPDGEFYRPVSPLVGTLGPKREEQPDCPDWLRQLVREDVRKALADD